MANASKRMKLMRPLPPELLSEMHKCLPFEQQLDLIVNVPSQAIVLNNAPRVRRTLKHIQERICNVVAENDIHNWYPTYFNIQDPGNGNFKPYSWKPEFGALIRFGTAFTQIRNFALHNNTFSGEPENLIEDLIFQLANLRSTKAMLKSVLFYVECKKFPKFLADLIHYDCKIGFWNKHCKLFANLTLHSGNGRSLKIIDGEKRVMNGEELKLFILNPIERKWFRVEFKFKLFGHLKFCYEEMPSLEEDVQREKDSWNDRYHCLEQPGNGMLKSNRNIKWDYKWDLFMRRGVEFTRFRHFQIDKGRRLSKCPPNYEQELICYMAGTSHPEHMLESMAFKMENYLSNGSLNEIGLLKKIWQICKADISANGTLLNYEGKKYTILQGTASEPRVEHIDGGNGLRQFYWMEFTLANGPSNEAYVFDVEMKFTSEREKQYNKVVVIKIRKRKKEDAGQAGCSKQQS